MKKIKLFIFAALCFNSSILLATTFTLNTGWNLLGTIDAIPVTQILANTSVKNVVIYQNGIYKASNNNEFTTVPAKSGFFVYSDSSNTFDLTTVNTTVALAKLDGNGTELLSDAASWEILHIKDESLYVEMKNDFTAGQSFIFSTAITYCSNLVIGSISGWRSPSISELTGVLSIYNLNPDYFTKLISGNYWSSTIDATRTNGYIYSSLEGVTGNDYPVNSYHGICVKTAP